MTEDDEAGAFDAGSVGSALRSNRALRPEHLTDMLDKVLEYGREPLRRAGMSVEVEGDVPSELVLQVLAERAAVFVAALGDDSNEEMEVAARLLVVLAVLFDAHRAFTTALDDGGDPRLAGTRLVFASAALGTLDAFRAIAGQRVFRDAARGLNDKALRLDGARKGGKAGAATRRANNAGRDKEIVEAFLNAHRRNPRLTVRSWAMTHAGEARWGIGAKRLQTIVRRGRRESCSRA